MAAAETATSATAQRFSEPSWTRSRLPALRRFIHRILPVHTYAPLRMELHMAWVRFTSRGEVKKYRGAADLLVNLGAGPNGLAGWVNVDAYRQPGINCVWDCRKSLPFPDASARGIFCEHFFEHIDYIEEAPYFLRECRRVLKPGGVLRLIVPDAEKYLRAYCAAGWEELIQMRPLHAGLRDSYTGQAYRTKMELINFIFRQGHEHRYAYDYETLAALLRDCGFGDVRRQEFGQSVMPEICRDQAMRASESLYVEAVA